MKQSKRDKQLNDLAELIQTQHILCEVLEEIATKIKEWSEANGSRYPDLAGALSDD